jgi:hypothetical protein
MNKGFRAFFNDVPPILVKEPLAETLGAIDDGQPMSYSFTDLVKLAGHACPTMAGAYLAVQAALGELFGGAVPVRGTIAVTVYGEPDEGTFGVMAAAFTLITGAAPATGFKGLGPLYKRKDLLKFSRESPDPRALCFEFQRVDTGRAVLVKFTPRAIPFAAEKSRRMGELMEKVTWEAARPEERAEFQELWMEKVRIMLVERLQIQDWLNVTERSA